MTTRASLLEKHLLADLKNCSKTRNLERGKQVHADAVQCGHDSSIGFRNALINMYAKCGSMLEARDVFDRMQHCDLVSWNALILGYAANGEGFTALLLFTKLKHAGPAPDSVTFLAALKACTSFTMEGASGWEECSSRGNAVHNLAVEHACDCDMYFQNALIDMYAKCGSMRTAQNLFDGMKHPQVVSWNALILGYAATGEGFTTLQLFARMQSKGVAPDSVTFLAALKACYSLAVTEGWSQCRQRVEVVYNLAVENGCNSKTSVQNTLIDMYSKCRNMLGARRIFDSMQQPNVISWTVLISGHADNGEGLRALALFTAMRSRGFVPSSITMVAVIKACSCLAVKGLECRKALHSLAVESGCVSSVFVQNALISMYGKCGSMVEALQTFKSMHHLTTVSWNALIMGYAENGQGFTALSWFTKMRGNNLAPDSVTYVNALKACTSLERRSECGIAIHELAVENGFSSDIYIQTSLIDMYAKCGRMRDARLLFDVIKHPNVVSWTALILGYAEAGEGHIALDLFLKMRAEGHAPDSVTFAAALKACCLVGALVFGRTLHWEIEDGPQRNITVVLVNSLVDFYAKCGSPVEARKVFESHSRTRNLVTWNSLLAAFSAYGDDETVFGLFQGMQDAGFRPDGVTFLCILTCCRHAGLVDKAKECFCTMIPKYGVTPTVEHYTCMVDILGRANKLDDAMALLRCMPCTPDDVIWMTMEKFER